MKEIRFHPQAEAEMISAAVWYENRQMDLGKRFLAAVQDSLNRIKITPKSYPLVGDNVRRCLAKTFPFSVIFRDQADAIVIVAIMHLHREPGYWRTRSYP